MVFYKIFIHLQFIVLLIVHWSWSIWLGGEKYHKSVHLTVLMFQNRKITPSQQTIQEKVVHQI